MDRKIRVGAVSYLNTKPLVYGLENGLMNGLIELSFDYPAKIAEALLNDRIDVGLVPVAILPQIPQYEIISDYCIACNGEVASVCLFSEVPLEEIETILLDYQSRTSAVLLKILLKEYWNIAPELMDASAGYEERIGGKTAGLMIGDRALKQRERSGYVYDLGSAWKELTNLPFVFAAWISKKQLSIDFVDQFNQANKLGIQLLEEIAEKEKVPFFDLKKYYTKHLNYRFNTKEKEGLELFLSKLKDYQ